VSEQSFVHGGHRHRGRGFLESLANGLAAAMEHALDAELMAAKKGLLQGLDPRVKLAALGGADLRDHAGRHADRAARPVPARGGTCSRLGSYARPAVQAGVARRPAVHRSDRAAIARDRAWRAAGPAPCAGLDRDPPGPAQRRFPDRPRRDRGDLRAAADPHDPLAARAEGVARARRAGDPGRAARE
jgi:hypothetical protein